MLTALTLSATLALQAVSQAPAPQPYTAQCLTEVGRMMGWSFSIWDDRARAGVIAKADQLMDLSKRLLHARQELLEANQAALAETSLREADGRLPPGSVEVERERMARELQEIDRPRFANQLEAPSCPWPTLEQPR